MLKLVDSNLPCIYTPDLHRKLDIEHLEQSLNACLCSVAMAFFDLRDRADVRPNLSSNGSGHENANSMGINGPDSCNWGESIKSTKLVSVYIYSVCTFVNHCTCRGILIKRRLTDSQPPQVDRSQKLRAPLEKTIEAYSKV